MRTEPYPAAELAARKFLELSEAVGDTAGAGWAESRLALLGLHSGKDDVVLPLVERALARLEPLGDGRDLADALHTKGWFLWRKGRIDEAEPLLRRAVEMAGRVGERASEAHIMNSLGCCVAAAGRPEEGIAILEESYRIAKEAGDVRVLGRLYNNLASVLVDYPGKRGRAEAILKEGFEVTSKAGLPNVLDWIVGALGDFALLSGRLEEAERYERESLEIGRTNADAPLVASRVGTLAWIRLLRGDVEEATRLQEEHARLGRGVPEPQTLVLVHLGDGLVARANGRDEEAVECFLRGLETLKGVSVGGSEALLAELVRTLVALGRPEEAAGYGDAAHIELIPPAYLAALPALIQGLVADDPADAVASLHEAVDRYGELEMPIEQARALIDLARAQKRAGEDPRSSLERARDLLASCGAEYYVREAEAELAALTR
jgi:tetratricopeptide (TPR) repeat protein